MIRIGIIVDIGSGKSFVAKQFGFPIFNADKEVKKIYRNNRQCFEKLNKKFPKKIKNFPIKKSEIKEVVSNKNIKTVSKIVHPYVRTELNKFLKKNKKEKWVVLDIPLLIENKLFKKSDILIGIKTSKKTIIKRLKKRGNFNKKLVNFLNAQQLNINKKLKLCNFIIENNSHKNNILKQIKGIKQTLND